MYLLLGLMAQKAIMMISATGNSAMRQLRAITFIELLLVIAIIGILTGISISTFRKTFEHLQLRSFSRELQTFMNYLSQRSIVEGKPIYLNIDNEQRQYWAKIKDAQNRLKTYKIPAGITIEAEEKQIIFYPDGDIDKITINLAGFDEQKVTLTTKGVFGSVKLQSQE